MESRQNQQTKLKRSKNHRINTQVVMEDGKEVEYLPEFVPLSDKHQLSDFDVEISHIITFKNGNSLYLGNQMGAGVHYHEPSDSQTAQDLQRLESLNIKGIVTCRAIKPKFENKFEYHIIPMDKDQHPNVDISKKMRSSYDFITKKLETGSVFVHCEHGRTRSATTVAYFLMRYFNTDLFTVKEFLKTRRDIVKLKKFEEKLLALYQSDVIKS